MTTNRLKLSFILISLIFLKLCTVQKMINIESSYQETQQNIHGVVTMTDDWIEFASPALLSKGVIKGVVRTGETSLKEISIPVREIKILWVGKNSFSESIWNLLSVLGIPVLFAPQFLVAGSIFSAIVLIL